MRYLPDFRLPDKALDLVDQACAATRFRTLTPVEKKSRGGTPLARSGVRRSSHFDGLRVGREEIGAVVAARCGIPLGTLTADEEERLKRLEELLSGRVKGQPEAIAAVADAVRLARVGLKKQERPAGVLLFVGQIVEEFGVSDSTQSVNFLFTPSGEAGTPSMPKWNSLSA